MCSKTFDDRVVTSCCPALFQVFLAECGKATYSRSLPTTGYRAVKCLYQPANAVRCSSVNCLRVKSKAKLQMLGLLQLLSSYWATFKKIQEKRKEIQNV